MYDFFHMVYTGTGAQFVLALLLHVSISNLHLVSYGLLNCLQKVRKFWTRILDIYMYKEHTPINMDT